MHTRGITTHILILVHGMQALQLWLQYLTLLAGVNMPTPYALHWVFSAANYAFSAVTATLLSRAYWFIW